MLCGQIFCFHWCKYVLSLYIREVFRRTWCLIIYDLQNVHGRHILCKYRSDCLRTMYRRQVLYSIRSNLNKYLRCMCTRHIFESLRNQLLVM
jgi:hypothetical protein